MEFNNELIEQMKASAIEIVVEGNEQVKIAILLDHGNAGEIVKMKHKNEWVYSYMSEDELYKRITGMSKTNYEMQQEVFMANNNTEQNRFIAAYSGSWKGEFKKHYTPADFKKVDSIINTCLNQEVSEETLALYVSLAKVYYILKATLPPPDPVHSKIDPIKASADPVRRRFFHASGNAEGQYISLYIRTQMAYSIRKGLVKFCNSLLSVIQEVRLWRSAH